MTRAELLTTLADLVDKGHITLVEAQFFLAQFDAGEIDGLPLSFVPLRQDDQGAWELALFIVLLLLRPLPLPRRGAGSGGTSQQLTASQSKRAQGLLRSQFEANSQRLAITVASGSLAVTAWQAGMMSAVSTYAYQMAVAGAGKLPGLVTRSKIAARVQDQQDYLRRFSTQVLVQKVVGRPIPVLAIASRAQSYGGEGWAAWFVGNESEQGDAGYIAIFHARDDRGTCGECHHAAAEGPYLVGAGPMPGIICRGKGGCRCYREVVYDMEAWLRLTGAAPTGQP